MSILESPQERAARIGASARNRVEQQVAREAWIVTKPGGDAMLVLFNPPQTQAEVLTVWYPSCGVTVPTAAP